MTVGVIFTQNVKGTEIDVHLNCRGPASELRTGAQYDLAPAGKVATIMCNDDTPFLEVDYADATIPPSTLIAPSGSPTVRTFTINGQEIASTSNIERQFSTTVPFEQVVIAAKQAGPTGIIDLNDTTLSVTGLVTDDIKDPVPEAIIPVVHTVTDRQAAGSTTLQLNNWTLSTTSSVTDPWLTFTYNNGTRTPTHESTGDQDEAAILNRAAELQPTCLPPVLLTDRRAPHWLGYDSSSPQRPPPPSGGGDHPYCVQPLGRSHRSPAFLTWNQFRENEGHKHPED